MSKENKVKGVLSSVASGIGQVIGNPTIGGIISSVASMATNILGSKAQRDLVNNEMSGAEKQAFELNSQEAQKARDWNLEMDSTKYQRTVSDMQAAGVNPALAMNGGVSTQAGSNVMANASTTQTNPTSAVADFATSIANLQLSRAQKDKVSQEAQALRIQNGVAEITALRKALADVDLTEKTAEQKAAEKRSIEAEIKVKESTLKLNEKQYSIYEQTIEKMKIENSNLDNLMKQDIALKVAEAGIKEAELESYDWNNAKMMTLSEAKSISGNAGLNVVGNGANIGMGDSHSKTVMGYLIFNRKSKTYSFIAAGDYMDTNLSDLTSRDKGEGGHTSVSGGAGYTGGSHSEAHSGGR